MELLKYYARDLTQSPHPASAYAVYLASEADAALEEKDAHHKQVVEILEKRIENLREQAGFINTKHAEEIERLKAEHANEVAAIRAEHNKRFRREVDAGIANELQDRKQWGSWQP